MSARVPRLLLPAALGWFLVGCADNGTVAEWESLRDAALTAHAPAVDGERWDADLALRVSPAALEDLARLGVEAELARRGEETLTQQLPLGVTLTAKTQLSVRELTLSLTDRCAGCLHVEGTLGGTVEWSLGGGIGDTTPIEVRSGADLRLNTVREEHGWTLTTEVTAVEDLDVKLARLGTLDAGRLFAKELDDFVERGQVFPVATLGGEELPLTELRFDKNRRGLTLLGRSAVAGPAIRAGKRELDDGFEVRLSTETLLAHLRREAFAAGPGDMELAGEPRGLSVDGEQFTLDLRLWKLVRQGWWRDVRVTGRVVLQDGEIRLEPVSAEEVASSTGAEAADPLMFLARSLLLDGVRKQLRQALPNRHEAQVGEHTYAVEVTRVVGQQGALVVRGQVTRQAAARTGGLRRDRG